MKKLSGLLLGALALAGCYRAPTPPLVTTTTTITCPAGTQLQSDGMCRAAPTMPCPLGTQLYSDGVCRAAPITCPPGMRLYSDGVCR